MSRTPRIVRMIVPVSPSTPNVQNVVICSLHSSYGNASNIGQFLLTTPARVVTLPLVAAA